MFYRKYRPKNFSQIYGNTKITDNLKNSIIKGNLGHALLFYGPRGTGKTSTARLVAKALACENFSKIGDACLECTWCTLVQNGKYTDLIEIDAASNNSVDNIRDLNDRVNLSPTHGKFKFYIIDEVHMLSKGAFNALLKTLEEPPHNTYFVLATTEPEKVLDTIKSRCRQFEFKRATTKDIVEKLKYIVESEAGSLIDEASSDAGKKKKDTDSSKPASNFTIPVSDLKRIAEASKGGFRDAETMLEQVIIGGLSVDDVLSTIGISLTAEFIGNLIDKNSTAAIKNINDIYANGKNLESWNKEVLFYLRQLVLVQNNLQDLVELDKESLATASKQSANLSTSFILKCLRAFNTSLENFKVTYIPTLPLEMAVLEVLGDLNSVASVPSAGNPNTPDSSTPEKGNKGSAASSRENVTREDKETAGYTDTKESHNNEEADLLSSFEKIDLPEDTNETMNPYINEDNSSVNTNEVSDSKPTLKPEFNWSAFLAKIEEVRPTLSVTLNNCKYVGFVENSLVVEANYVFHKERLEITATKTLLQNVLFELLGAKHNFVCRVAKRADEDLTDRNVSYITVKSDEIPMSSPKSKEDEFAIPDDDPNFVASPVNTEKQKEKKGSGDALNDFGGEFNV